MSGVEEQSERRKEVAVVGGGLVGSLHAILLSQRGFRVQLYESRKDMRKEKEVSGRSINLTLCHRGREALKIAGLEEDILKYAIPVSARKIHTTSGKTYTDSYGTKGECMYSINRRALNELLLTKAEETFGITLHFEHKLTRACLETKSLVFQVGTTDPKEVTVETDFIFGCDGAHSTVRRQMMRWGRLNYSQEYMEHSYKELTLPPAENGEYAAEPDLLHIWPRKEFMMFALPNRDQSFSLTFVMPLKTLDSIETREDVLAFFTRYFPDVVDKIGVDRLLEDYSKNPIGKLISVKCFPHFMADSTLLLGDAAHAMVPFYGQGVNAGFEDCLVFYNLLAQSDNDLATAAQKYQDTHWKDTQTICDLSMENYIVMCSHVTSPLFLLRRRLDGFLHSLFPRLFPHLYTMMAFSTIPYHEVVQRHSKQRTLLKRGTWLFSLFSFALLAYLLFRYSGLKGFTYLSCIVSV